MRQRAVAALRAPRTRQGLVTLAVAACGGLLFDWLDMPAAWLGGAAIAVALATLAGLKTTLLPGLRRPVFLVLGTSMGTGIEPSTLHRMAEWPVSLALLAPVVAGVVAGSYWVLRRIAGWDRATAFYASIPGALSYVMAVAIQSPADIRRVATSQSIRLLTLVAVLPLVLGGPAMEAAAADPAFPQVYASPADCLLLLVVAGLAGLLFDRFRVPAGMLTGAFLASAVLHGAGLVAPLPLPLWLAGPAFVCLGALAGSRMSGIGIRELGATAVVSTLALLAGLVVSLSGAFAVVSLTSAGLPQALLAFAPGGLDAMVAIAVILHMDPAFVATHQLARLIGILVCLPGAIRLMGIPGGKTDAGKTDAGKTGPG